MDDRTGAVGGGGDPLVPLCVPMGRWLQSFRYIPPRQKPGSFSLDQVMEQLTSTVRT